MASVDSLSIRITASATDAQRKIDGLVASLNNLVSAINSLDTSKFDALANSTERLSEGLAGVKGSGVNTVKKMAKALQEVSTEKNAYQPIADGAQKVAEETTQATQSIAALPTALNDIDASKLTDVSGAIEGVSDSLNKTSSRLSWFKSMLAGLKIIVPTEGLDTVNKKIEKLTVKVADLKDRLAYKSQIQPDYVDSAEMEKDQKQIEGLINELERLKLKKQELESNGGFKLNLSGSLTALNNAVSKINKRLDSFISKIRKAKSATRETAKATNDFKTTADRLVKSLTRVTKMLKLMVTRMALRAVIKEVGNGFKSLALHSDEFNQSMSGLINASKKLGYSFAGMVGPLINALAPALIYIINLMTRLINIINQVFAALSGKSTYNRAKDFSENWAENISDANKQAKELKKTVLGFDELNQLQEKYTSGGDTSGNIVDMFETMPIEDKWKEAAAYIKNIAKKLFDPIKKAWGKVGDFVKKSWKYAMDEVFKLGKSVADDFWEVWNQEKTQKIFENILKIIGYIGQAVGNLAKRFREAWDKNDRGLHILENIRDIVLIVVQGFERMAEATAEWADNLDFAPILEAVENWLASCEKAAGGLMGILEDFYTTVILPLGKWAVEEGGPALLKVFTDFNDQVDWQGLRDKLQELWEHLEPFAETVGNGLIEFINRCAQGLAEFINGQAFTDFLAKVEEWMDGITSEDVANAIEIVAKAFIALKVLGAILTLLTSIGTALAALPSILAGIIVLLKGILLVGEFILLLDLTTYIASIFDPETYGQYTGLLGALNLIKDTLSELAYYVETVIEDVKIMFKFFTFQWGDIGEGDLYKVIRDASDFNGRQVSDEFRQVESAATLSGISVKEFMQNMTELKNKGAETAELSDKFKEFAKYYKAAGDAVGETGEKVKGSGRDFAAAADQFAGSGKNFETVSQNVKSSADKFESLNVALKKNKDNTSALAGDQRELDAMLRDLGIDVSALSVSGYELSSNYESLTTNTSAVSEQSKKAADTFAELKNAGDKIVQNTSGLVTSQQNVKESLNGVIDKATQYKTDVTASFDAVDLEVANSGITMTGTFNEISKSSEDTTNDLLDDTKKIQDAFSEDKWTFSGVWEGLKKTFEKAKESIKGAWNKIADKLNGEHDFGDGKIKINLPKFYAMGGFPEDGWFRASHGEMIGRFDNGQSVVANNQQIVDGIRQGVYEAVSMAMGTSQGADKNIYTTIQIDGETIARAVTKGQTSLNRRYSPVTT